MSLFRRTLGRISFQYLFPKYVFAGFFIYACTQLAQDPDTSSFDTGTLILLCICGLFYPYACFAWDYLTNYTHLPMIFGGVYALLFLFIKLVKFLIIFFFSPLITLGLFFILWFDAWLSTPKK